jgi:hypothetical protein
MVSYPPTSRVYCSATQHTGISWQCWMEETRNNTIMIPLRWVQDQAKLFLIVEARRVLVQRGGEGMFWFGGDHEGPKIAPHFCLGAMVHVLKAWSPGCYWEEVGPYRGVFRSLEGTWVPRSFFFSPFASWLRMRWLALVYHMLPPWCVALPWDPEEWGQSIIGWNLKTVSPKKPFCLVSQSSPVFCYSDVVTESWLTHLVMVPE